VGFIGGSFVASRMTSTIFIWELLNSPGESNACSTPSPKPEKLADPESRESEHGKPDAKRRIIVPDISHEPRNDGHAKENYDVRCEITQLIPLFRAD